ncbi:MULTISPECIES: response regulator [unclassified Okeania]|uniref:hybrid sensor histidine kinase/response regulator n=1 Tax=unclassified Okeania TaxID=2634635 RepID=UPI0013BD925B|nr:MULTISPECIES: response regulator [unclassified Okeania]NES74621.1 response regulator [Okeania sp. SIO1H4]NET12802.1 response regulator [Okeania sp. SIO1H6]NET18695.1 response regulator [Okeania sp. SIO1H5]NET92342.1 response regulator [Okeania sp. SIO1H2]
MPDPTQPFILIVDDKPTNLSVLSKALKAAGYKVRMAVDGEDALAQVQRHHPDMILLDIDMPKIDGFETCIRLQANQATKGIPVIFMTAIADTEDKVKGLSLGAVDYITKPFEEAEVLARVKVHWRLKRLTDTLEQQVSERTQALQQAQVQLVQQEKLSALGQLVAGVAHEINNPIGSMVGNVSVAQDYINDLLGIIDLYREKFPQPGAEIEEALEASDLNYMREDLPKLVKSMKDAGDRIQSISRSLRTFSRADSDTKRPFDLHEGIDSTILILRHRLNANENRSAIEVVTDYGNIPKIVCFSGQLNQVFMNILANAIDALDESDRGRDTENQAHSNLITIKTQLVDEQVKIAIADNGKGMSQEVKAKIFDHLFTTKAIGKGTGLGLAIARQIIVEKHGGEIHVDSILGEGTEFIISLPTTANRKI